MITITSFRWTSIFNYFAKEYVIILWEFPTQEKVKESGREKRKKKKFYTPFSWFVLISGTDLVLACQSDSESYYGFGSWHLTLVKSQLGNQTRFGNSSKRLGKNCDLTLSQIAIGYLDPVWKFIQMVGEKLWFDT